MLLRQTLQKHAAWSEVHLHRGVTPLEKDGPITSPRTNACFSLSNDGLPRATSVLFITCPEGSPCRG